MHAKFDWFQPKHEYGKKNKANTTQAAAHHFQGPTDSCSVSALVHRPLVKLNLKHATELSLIFKDMCHF